MSHIALWRFLERAEHSAMLVPFKAFEAGISRNVAQREAWTDWFQAHRWTQLLATWLSDAIESRDGASGAVIVGRVRRV